MYFADNLPGNVWQSSDRDLTSFGLDRVLAQSGHSDLPPPLELDIANWPDLTGQFDAVYSANCIHIIDAKLVPPYVAGASQSLKPGGLMLLYGPYKYGGEFSTQSNADFDGFLRSTYSGGCIKDFETLNELSRDNGLVFEQDIAMPANNQFLIWRKTG